MKKVFFTLIFGLAFSAFLNADIIQNKRVQSSTEVLKKFVNADFLRLKSQYIDDVKAIAILPSAVKAGLLATATVGDGILVVKNSQNEWGSPIFIKLRALGAGIQAGYLSSDVVILFQNLRALEAIFQGRSELEINIAASFLKGKRIGAMTDFPEISAWTVNSGKSSGLFVGWSVDLAKISLDNIQTTSYYDRIFEYEDIIENSPRMSRYTASLREILDKDF